MNPPGKETILDYCDKNSIVLPQVSWIAQHCKIAKGQGKQKLETGEQPDASYMKDKGKLESSTMIHNASKIDTLSENLNLFSQNIDAWAVKDDFTHISNMHRFPKSIWA